jgi:hypothetical protein
MPASIIRDGLRCISDPKKMKAPYGPFLGHGLLKVKNYGGIGSGRNRQKSSEITTSPDQQIHNLRNSTHSIERCCPPLNAEQLAGSKSFHDERL